MATELAFAAVLMDNTVRVWGDPIMVDVKGHLISLIYILAPRFPSRMLST